MVKVKKYDIPYLYIFIYLYILVSQKYIYILIIGTIAIFCFHSPSLIPIVDFYTNIQFEEFSTN